MGLVFLATPFIGMFNREWHSETLLRLAGRGGPVVAGAAFAIAWTPCTSITLSAILTQAAISGSAAHGALLLAFYSAGLAIPFLLIALAFERMTNALTVVKRHFPVIIGIGGAVMIVLGVLILTGEFTILNAKANTLLQGTGLDISGILQPLVARRVRFIALFPSLLVALGVEHERRVADRLDDRRLTATGEGRGRSTSTNSTTRVSSVSFQTSWLKVSSKIMLLPSSQWRKSSPTRIRQASASCGHDQPEVVAQHALVGAAVVEDVLARGEDREHRRRHPRDLPHQRGRPRAHLDAELGLEAVAVEEERLPAVVVGDLDLVLGDVLEVGQRLTVLEHALELLADRLPVGLDSRDPGEAVDREEGRLAHQRALPDEPLDRRERPFRRRRSSSRPSAPTALSACTPLRSEDSAEVDQLRSAVRLALGCRQELVRLVRRPRAARPALATRPAS